MTRRDFNYLSALALAAPVAWAEDLDWPWKLGVITDEVDFNLPAVLSGFCPKYGLKFVEIRDLALNGAHKYVYKQASPQELKEIRKRLDDAGVTLSVLDTAVYKITLPGTVSLGEAAGELHPSSGEYGQQLDDLRRGADAAHVLGSDRLRIFAFNRVADPDAIFDRIVEELGKAIEAARAQGVTLVLENEHSCNFATGTQTAKLFKAIPDRKLMHNWDPGNCFEAGEEPYPKAWDQLDHTRISHIHLKDAKGKSWMPIGSGEIDSRWPCR